MKNVHLYQIKDHIGHTMAGPIMTVMHEAAAVRYFMDMLRDNTTMIGKHPEDYSLVFLGYQDDETGAIDPRENPLTILKGSTWAEAQTPTENSRITADGRRVPDID